MTIERGPLEDILSKDTYDYISVDSQHSPFNEYNLVALCAIAEDIGIDVHFRIKHTRQSYLLMKLSTQLKVSSKGKLSRIAMTRCRIVSSSFARFLGATTGLTTLR